MNAEACLQEEAVNTAVPLAPNAACRAREKRKVYLAIAGHYANNDVLFVQSLAALMLRTTVPLQIGWSCDPSVERARNILTANFLESDCTHLLFIDADIGFSAEDVARIASHDQPVVGGMYPLKNMEPTVQWCGNALVAATPSSPKVAVAPPPPRVTATPPSPVDTFPGAATMPTQGAGPVPPGCPDPVAAPGTPSPCLVPFTSRPDGLLAVRYIGTGFLCLARAVFEKLIAVHGPALAYRQDYPPNRREYAFWQQGVSQDRFLTEDWLFCQRWHELGGEIFADPAVVLRHAGRAEWPLPFQAGNPFVSAGK